MRMNPTVKKITRNILVVFVLCAIRADIFAVTMQSVDYIIQTETHDGGGEALGGANYNTLISVGQNGISDENSSSSYKTYLGFIHTVASAAGKPNPVWPTNGLTNLDLSIPLFWGEPQSGNPPFSYTVELDNNADFSSPEINQPDIIDTMLTISGLSYSTTYFWRVMAKNDYGESGWSTEWSFTTLTTTDTAPSIPVLSTPANSSTDVNLSPVLLWGQSSGEGPITYTIQIDINNTFTNPAQYSTDSAWYQLGSLTEETTYYWRVSADNPAGNSGWSAPFSFTTIPAPSATTFPPSVPLPDTPLFNAQGVGIDVFLGWIASTGTSPVKYSVQSALDEQMTQLVYNKADILNTFTEVSGLLYDIQYYWQVKAVNDYGESAWSDVWPFKTKAEEVIDTGGGDIVGGDTVYEYALIITSPSALSFYAQYAGSTTPAAKKLTVFNGGTVSFTWTLQKDVEWMIVNPVTGSSAQITDVNVAVDVSGMPPGVHSGMITISAENASNSPVSVPVTLFIYTDTSSGSSDDDGTGGTTGGTSAPSKPNLLSPENGINGLYPAPKLTWESIGATYYLQVSKDQGFGTLLVNRLLETNEYQVIGVEFDTVYYWRVKAVNSAGMSQWSDTWWFKMKDTGGKSEDKTKSCFIRAIKR